MKRGKNYWEDDYKGYYKPAKNSFSWGSWGGWASLSSSLEEDEDSSLFIKGSDGYFTPKKDDIRWGLDRRELTKNQKNIDLVKNLSRFFYWRMVDDKDYISSTYSVKDEDVQQTIEFYEDLWDKFIPGYTPLEKAWNVIDSLKEDQGTSGGFKLNLETANSISIDERVYRDPVYNELLDENAFGRDFKLDIINKISLVRDLGEEFKVEKEIDEKIVPNSSEKAKKMMTDFSQLANIELYQRLMPDFNLKLLTKNVTVNVPIDRTEHKQKIIILLDYSGSMSEIEKQKWVVAILADRLRYVIKGEAEIFFSYFIHRPEQMFFHHLKDKKSVMDFWRIFSNSPNGGDTAIGAMVNRIDSEIKQGKLMNLDVDLREEKPEILVINDGQDSVKTSGFTYKTNAITLVDGRNEELKNLCIANKGKYIFVRGKEADLYSVSGHQKMKV